MSETILPSYEETLKFVEDRVRRTEELWNINPNGSFLKGYYEGQYSEAQRILEFLKTGISF